MSFEKLISGSKLPVLFIGSGLSRRYIGLPDWESLLESVYNFLDNKDFHYKHFKAKVKNTLSRKNMSVGEINALIASRLKEKFNKYYFESNLVNEYPEWLNENVSPFKMCISSQLENYIVSEEKIDEIELFKKLRGKLHSIITTNYDTFIEDLFEFRKESIFIGQHQLFNSTSVEIDELYKLHGCVSMPERILITKEDYDDFTKKAKLFSAKLMTLISENPIVFLGYSIQDPNVQGTLSNFVSCLTKSQIEQLKNHFYIINYKRNEKQLIEEKYMFDAKSYDGTHVTFPVTIINTDNYAELYKQLYKLNPAMNISVVKQVKRIVKEIVVKATKNTNKIDPILTVMIDDLEQISSEEYDKLEIAAGKAKTIGELGYGIKHKVEVFEDVLFNNKYLDPKRVLMGTYENHYLKIRTNIPIYKYISKVNHSVVKNLPRVKSYIKEKKTVNNYLNSSLIRSLARVPVGNKINDMPDEFKKARNRKYNWIFKNIDRLALDDIQEFLRHELSAYDKFDSNEKSNFHRLISIYDMLKYKK